MDVLYVATHNAHKLDEFRELFKAFPFALEAIPDGIPDCPETAATFEGNAMDKAVFYGQYVDGWVMADDSGLCVEALGGQPGIRSARYAGVHGDSHANNEKLLNEMKDIPDSLRKAKFVCALVLWHRGLARGQLVQGTVEGQVLRQLRGIDGFGYDPLFYLPQFRRTMAELTMQEKNQVSHRGAAVRALARSWGGQAYAHLPRE